MPVLRMPLPQSGTVASPLSSSDESTPLATCLQVGFDLAVQQVTTGLAARLQASFAAVLRVDIFENPLVYMQCQVDGGVTGI